MNIEERLHRIWATLPEGVKLVAVSKFHPAERLQKAYLAGQRIFGESRPQEMAAKAELLPKDIEWHMIGHLQTNKVKLIAPFVTMVSSVDSALWTRFVLSVSRRVSIWSALYTGQYVWAIAEDAISHVRSPRVREIGVSARNRVA